MREKAVLILEPKPPRITGTFLADKYLQPDSMYLTPLGAKVQQYSILETSAANGSSPERAEQIAEQQELIRDEIQTLIRQEGVEGENPFYNNSTDVLVIEFRQSVRQREKQLSIKYPITPAEIKGTSVLQWAAQKFKKMISR